MKQSCFKFASKHKICLVILLTNLGAVSPVIAKEIYFKPSISIQTEYDDNKRLKTNRFNNIDTSAFGIITRVNAKVGARSDRYEVALDNQFILNRYKSAFDLDSEDFNFNLTSNYQLTERNNISLGASFKRDTTLTSELDVNGSGSGIIQDNIRHEQWSIDPSWSYTLSSTQFLQASYTHAEHNYKKSAVGGGLVNYTIDNFSSSFTQQWTPLFSNFLSFSALSFKIPKIEQGNVESSRKTTEYSINIGAQYQIAPTWSTSLSVGERFTTTKATQTLKVNNFDLGTTSNDVQGLIFSFSLDKQFETGKANITYSRSTSPQGQGRLQVSENLVASFDHRFNQKLQVTLNGSLNDVSTSGNVNDGNDRTYFDIRPTIRWGFDKQTSLTASYRYRTQSFNDRNEEAISNAVILNFNYRWDKISTQKY
ncbi:MAG: hypothetical protein QM500_15375 [Methylococcales bacterium]